MLNDAAVVEPEKISRYDCIIMNYKICEFSIKMVRYCGIDFELSGRVLKKIVIVTMTFRILPKKQQKISFILCFEQNSYFYSSCCNACRL